MKKHHRKEVINNNYKCAAISHLTDEGSNPDGHLHLPLDSIAKEKFQTGKSLQGRFITGPTNLAKLEKLADHHSS